MAGVLIGFASFSQSTHWYTYVKSIKEITWNQKTTVTTTDRVEGNKVSGTIAGAAVGHWLFHKSLLGTIVGGAVGNAASTSSSEIVTNHEIYTLVKGYEILLDNGRVIKTFEYYPKWSVIDLSKIKIQE